MTPVHPGATHARDPVPGTLLPVLDPASAVGLVRARAGPPQSAVRTYLAAVCFAAGCLAAVAVVVVDPTHGLLSMLSVAAGWALAQLVEDQPLATRARRTQ
jgi:hypothetical protein